MTNDEIREIVRITINELANRNMIRTDRYQIVLKSLEPKLREFFKTNKDNRDKQMGQILYRLSGDSYIDIIYSQYRDGITMERIAEEMDKDVSTIKRNKKRLMMNIYDLLKA